MERGLAGKAMPPAYLLDFVEVLARHPVPLGRTARERQRLAATLVATGPQGPAREGGGPGLGARRARR